MKWLELWNDYEWHVVLVSHDDIFYLSLWSTPFFIHDPYTLHEYRTCPNKKKNNGFWKSELFEKVQWKYWKSLILLINETIVFLGISIFIIFYEPQGSLIVILFLGLNYKDTQCGFKLFNGEIIRNIIKSKV